MWHIVLTTAEGDLAWLGTDGLAHSAPTPDPMRAEFASAREAEAAQIPEGWIAEAVCPIY